MFRVFLRQEGAVLRHQTCPAKQPGMAIFMRAGVSHRFPVACGSSTPYGYAPRHPDPIFAEEPRSDSSTQHRLVTALLRRLRQ